MSRRTLVVLGVVAIIVVILVLSSGSSRNRHGIGSKPFSSPQSPMPAGSPTVKLPLNAIKATTTSRSASRQKTIVRNPHENQGKSNNLSASLQAKLRQAVLLFASWPSSTPQRVLLGKLREEQPFVTAAAIQQIASEWRNVPVTFNLKAKGVIQISNLVAIPGNPNGAAVTVFVSLIRHFMPVSGMPYNQDGVQAFTVNMLVINRQWCVVGIAPQSTTSTRSTS